MILNCVRNLNSIVIRQGDLYSLPLTLKIDNAVVAAVSVSDVKVYLGSIVKTYLKGEVTFSNNVWYFPVTSAETSALSGQLPLLVEIIRLSGEHFFTPIRNVFIEPSLVLE